jgi:5-methylcytosine-specific restriction endonuclease McrA
MTDYERLLLDPRWEARRKSIITANGGFCERCAAEDTVLQVHHKYYKTGVMPWDYPFEAYLVLCKRCHEREHNPDIAKYLPEIGESRPIKTIGQVMIESVQLMIDLLKKSR